MRSYVLRTDYGAAFTGVGRNRFTTAPFGERVMRMADFARVAALNDRALRTVGMVALADELREGGRAALAGARQELAMRFKLLARRNSWKKGGE